MNKKDKKKKKKKKGKADKDKDEKGGSSAPLSATAKAILLRQQQFAEEEARIKKLQEEAERRIKEEEEREEAERKSIEEEKERKRKAKQEKLDAQKAAGTYMTKAEKEKKKKDMARLEAMRAAGMIVGGGDISGSTEKAKVVYTNKKKRPDIAKDKSEQTESDIQMSVSLETTSSAPATINEDDDDWESAADTVAANLEEKLVVATENLVEDKLETEKKAEIENLRLLGIERAKRDEELRTRRS